MNRSRKYGFTLIELLVVISIMGLLASIILSSVNTARMKARDTQRIQALEEMRKALTLYYHDNGKYPTPRQDGTYPSPSAATPSTNFSTCPLASTSWACLQANLNAGASYIPTLPVDPVNNLGPFGGTTAFAYRYDVDPTGQMYSIVAKFEAKNPLMCSTDGGVTSKYKALFSTNLYTTGDPICPPSFVSSYAADYFYYVTSGS